MIDNLQEEGPGEYTLAYCYCDFRNEQSTKSATVTRTLLSQFVRAGWHSTDLFNAQKRRMSPPNDSKKLIPYLLEAIAFPPGPFIVVDALDECQDVDELIALLKKLNSLKKARIFVASRREQRIQESLYNISSIYLTDESAHLESDIAKLVDSDLGSRRRLARLASDIKSQISKRLLSRSDGM